jgi:hypothetical protein
LRNQHSIKRIIMMAWEPTCSVCVTGSHGQLNEAIRWDFVRHICTSGVQSAEVSFDGNLPHRCSTDVHKRARISDRLSGGSGQERLIA